MPVSVSTSLRLTQVFNHAQSADILIPFPSVLSRRPSLRTQDHHPLVPRQACHTSCPDPCLSITRCYLSQPCQQAAHTNLRMSHLSILTKCSPSHSTAPKLSTYSPPPSTPQEEIPFPSPKPVKKLVEVVRLQPEKLLLASGLITHVIPQIQEPIPPIPHPPQFSPITVRDPSTHHRTASFILKAPSRNSLQR